MNNVCIYITLQTSSQIKFKHSSLKQTLLYQLLSKPVMNRMPLIFLLIPVPIHTYIYTFVTCKVTFMSSYSEKNNRDVVKWLIRVAWVCPIFHSYSYYRMLAFVCFYLLSGDYAYLDKAFWRVVQICEFFFKDNLSPDKNGLL